MPAGSSRGERLDPLARTALRARLADYRGVAIRMEPPAGETAATVAVVLEHSDPALSLTLYRAADGVDVVAEWRAWGQALAVPLLVAEADGRLREPFERIGAVRVGRPTQRRRRRSALAARRPARALRRRPGTTPAQAVVHRGERELIARN
jgi:Family of unknown function (DUF6101)